MRRRKSKVGGAKVQRSSRPGGREVAARKVQTVTTYFRESLELLMERLFAAAPHFIRYEGGRLES